MEAGNGSQSSRSEAFQALRSQVAQLTPCFGVLAPLERRLVALRFGLGGGAPLSLRGVARALGISTGAARRAELRALGRLDGAARTGCAGTGASSASYVFDPSTVGDLLATKLGAGPTLAAGSSLGTVRGGPARASAGALPPSWPAADSAGFFRTALIALILVGSLLLLGGLALAGARPPLPASAEPAPARRRPAARSSRRRTTRHAAAQLPPARRPDHARAASVHRSSIKDR